MTARRKSSKWRDKKITAITLARVFCDQLDFEQNIEMDLLNEVAEGFVRALDLDDTEREEFLAIVNVNHTEED